MTTHEHVYVHWNRTYDIAVYVYDRRSYTVHRYATWLCYILNHNHADAPLFVSEGNPNRI